MQAIVTDDIAERRSCQRGGGWECQDNKKHDRERLGHSEFHYGEPGNEVGVGALCCGMEIFITLQVLARRRWIWLCRGCISPGPPFI